MRPTIQIGKRISAESFAMALGLAFGTLGAACHDHSRSDGSVAFPSYFEVEPNDFEEEANDFGLLFPNDYFWIEGDVREISQVPIDPRDGFAFTAGRPIHVDFRLVVDDPVAICRVGLFDPQLGETIAYYLQDQHGEVLGGVDVPSGALDFHLVVESTLGATTYGLEIDVFGLSAASASGSALAAPASASGLRASANGRVPRSRTDDPFRDYSRDRSLPAELAQPPSPIGKLHVIEIEPSGETRVETHALFAAD